MISHRYDDRLQAVLRYIDTHLEDDLTVETLSMVSGFSKYHFHRLFEAWFGLNVHRYVQLARLRRASYRLAFRDTPIIDIALESGYAGPEAFTRAFRQRVGQSPREFRKEPAWATCLAACLPIQDIRMVHMKDTIEDAQVRVVEVQPVRVAVLEHRGDPTGLADSIRRFITWRRAAGLPPKVSATYNILYNSPTNTPPGDFRLDLCAALTGTLVPGDAAVVEKVIPGGRCAVLRRIGSEDGLGDALKWLYVHWLPTSGHELRDFPPYLQRVTFFPDVPEYEAVVDIFVPLR